MPSNHIPSEFDSRLFAAYAKEIFKPQNNLQAPTLKG